MNWTTRSTHKSQCQVCGKLSHTALGCWHRYNQDLLASSSSFNDNNKKAMTANSCTTFDLSWYLNSGATTHITHDVHNLGQKASCIGPDRIHIVDGTGLAIDPICSSSFSSQFNSKTLFLNQPLVPSITKILLSVSKFSSDNGVYFEFFPHQYCVKYQVIHNISLRGDLSIDCMSSILPSSIQHQQLLLKIYLIWSICQSINKIVVVIIRTTSLFPVLVFHLKILVLWIISLGITD